MKKERIWGYVKETTPHLCNKPTKNIHLGVATRSSTKWKTHTIQQALNGPDKITKWINQRTQNYISKYQVWYINLRIKGEKHTPLTIFPDLEQVQIICGGVKLVSLEMFSMPRTIFDTFRPKSSNDSLQELLPLIRYFNVFFLISRKP